MNPNVWQHSQVVDTLPTYPNYRVIITTWTDGAVAVTVEDEHGFDIVSDHELADGYADSLVEALVEDALEYRFDAAHSTVGRSLNMIV